jgi:Zn-dependent peptidase ImmA (M78 family)
MTELTESTESTQTSKAEKRYSIIVGEDAQTKLASIAKEFKISQSVVVVTLLDNIDMTVMAHKFKAKREEKVSTRGTKKTMLSKLRSLTPEQLEKLLANL